ncbi:protein of unknown function [Xenorhabdus nematophila AN6/1]|nr:protein of unknown function [Xenorhabdus nematophila AN6/1]
MGASLNAQVSKKYKQKIPKKASMANWPLLWRKATNVRRSEGFVRQ